MRINSINGLNIPINNSISTRKKYTPSFGVYCTEYEKAIAKKY